MDAVLLSLGAAYFGLSARLAALGPALAVAQVIAGACDVVENAALLAVLAGRRRPLPSVATNAASLKFTLLAAGGGYLAAGFLSGR